MNLSKILTTFLISLPSIALATPNLTSLIKNSDVQIQLGQVQGTIDEIIFGDDYGDKNGKISHLIWDIRSMPSILWGISLPLHHKYTVHFETQLGFAGNHHMEDYDYLWPDLTLGEASDFIDPDAAANFDWQQAYNFTHFSTHPRTKLTHYNKFSIVGEREIFQKKQLRISTFLGFDYIDMGWDAWGGSIYHPNDIDEYFNGQYLLTGEFLQLQSNEKGINYRVSLPAFVGGLGIKYKIKTTEFDLKALIGQAFPADYDLHLLRQDRHPTKPEESERKPTVYCNLNGSIRSEVNHNTFILFSGTYQFSKVRKAPAQVWLNDDYLQLDIAYDGGENPLISETGVGVRVTTLSIGIEYRA